MYVRTHFQSRRALMLCISARLKEAAEKTEFFEGDGLQAVHNCFVVSAALACSEASCHSSGCKSRRWKLPSCHRSNNRRRSG